MTESQLDTFHELVSLWNESAAAFSKERFEIRFFPELDKLNRFRMKFPDEDPALLLRILAMRTVETFQQEFPAEEVLRTLPRLRRLSGRVSGETDSGPVH